MINRIIQTIIENKDFLEKSLEESVKASEISMFSRDLRKVFDEAGRKTIVGILETIDTILFESKKRKQEYETKDLRKTTAALSGPTVGARYYLLDTPQETTAHSAFILCTWILTPVTERTTVAEYFARFRRSPTQSVDIS